MSAQSKGPEKAIIAVSGMSCTGCAQGIEKNLKRKEGVIEASVNFAAEKAHIEFDKDKLTKEELVKIIEDSGYEAKLSGEGLDTLSFSISGMNCSSCAMGLENTLKNAEGIEQASVNFATEKATVNFDSKRITPEKIKEIVTDNGYEVIEDKKKAVSEEKTAVEKDKDLEKMSHAAKRMWFAASLAGPIMILMMIHMFVVEIPYYLPIIYILGFPVIFIAGRETHLGALKSVKNLNPNMDTLVSLGSLVPYLLNLLVFWIPITSFVEMAVSILTLHLVGRYLEAKAKGRASQAIKKLLEMEAKKARILVDGEEIEVPIEEVETGQVMVVRPGEKSPPTGWLWKEKAASTNPWLPENHCR